MSVATAGDWRSAMSTLNSFRTTEAMRAADGWMVVQFDRETRDTQCVFAFVLECVRSASDGSCDNGDRVFGYVHAGEVTTEQFA